MRVLEVSKIFNKLVAIFILAILGGFFLSQPTYAASDISVSNSGKVSFGKVQPSSSGTLATGQDILNITTDCEAGVNVYATSTNGGSTSLINLAAGSNNTITTSSNTISSPSSLENNTWGLNVINNNTFYGLPEYSASNLPSVIYSGTASSVPVYYGAKVTNTLAPGTYTGEVLYTVTVNNSCLDYTVKFNKNTNDASGDMSDQAILPTGGTLSENSFTYSGYTFLGWSLDPAGKTGTATNGIGTAEDVDFADKASFPGSNEPILPGSETTLYAIWEKQIIYMQNWFGCAKMAEGETIILTDSRDGNEYTVKKFGSGSDAECWMISNLTLGYDQTNNIPKGHTLTKDNTNIPDNTTYYLPPAGYMGYMSSPSTITSTTTVNGFSSPNDDRAKIRYAAASQTGSTNPQPTSYYNFNAVSLGYSYYNDNISSGDTPRDICPAGWQLPKGYSTGDKSWYKFYNTLNNGTHANIINGSGAAFPYSGEYSGSSLNGIDSYGQWWSSTIYNTEYSFFLSVDSSDAYPQSHIDKFYGLAVRCVAKYSDISGYMQDFDSNTELPNETDTTYLMDKRDNKVYAVKRLPDGKVWMMQNLTINGVELTPEDTNITDGNTYYLPKNGGRGDITDPNTKNSTSGFYFSDYSDTQASFKLRTKNANYTNDSNTGYYNFYAATLGYSYFGDNKTYGTSPQDICPKNWRLPRTTDAGTTISTIDINNDFTYLTSRYGLINNGTATSYNYYSTNSIVLNSMYNNAASPLATSTNNNLAGFSYSGRWDSTNSSASYAGSYGYYWSASIYNTTNSYSLYFDSSIFPQSHNTKYYGLAVRCVAKQPYTINYDANGGTGEMAPSKGYIGSSTLSRNTFTRDDYYFLGWSTNPSATTATYANGATISTNLAPAGGSITLYAIWIESDQVMQADNVCSTVTAGDTNGKTLIDSRDNQSYPIYRFADAGTAGTNYPTDLAGYCIMAKDLSLGYISSGFVVRGADLTLIADDSATTATISARTNTSDWDGVDSDSNKQYINGTGSAYDNHSYYSFGAAQAVCPKGWRLPTNSEYSNIITFVGGNNSNGSNVIRSNPYNFVYSGYFSSSGWLSVGNSGFYWSATQYSTDAYGNYLNLHSNGLYTSYYDKYGGFSVRCIAAP